MNRLFSFLLILALCAACREDQDYEVGPRPAANFIHQADRSDPQGLRVSFASTSENGDSFFWDFGDRQGVGAGPTRTYTYKTPGTYKVRLTVTNRAGVSSAEQDVTVTANYVTPVAGFEVVFDDLNNPLRVQLTDRSAGAAGYRWNFGDGTIVTGPNPGTHTYAQPGTYTIRLDIEGANQLSDVFTQPVYVADIRHLTGTGGTGKAWQLSELKITSGTATNVIPLAPCTANDTYTFSPGPAFAFDNDNAGDAALRQLRYACGAANRPAPTTWRLQRNSPVSLSLSVGASYLTDPDLANASYTLLELTADRLRVRAVSRAEETYELTLQPR